MSDLEAQPPSVRPVRKLVFVLVLLVLAVGLALLVFHGIQTRVRAEATLVRETESSAALSVGVIRPKRARPKTSWSFPATSRRSPTRPSMRAPTAT